MVAVVHGPTGTARGIGINSPYLIAGKTGTAQVVSNKNNLRLDPHNLPLHLRHQALFIAFAPADNPRIAVAVMVEHGGFGSSSAAPIARAIMDAWLLPKPAMAPMPETEAIAHGAARGSAHDDADDGADDGAYDGAPGGARGRMRPNDRRGCASSY